jgi:hypothetical protein
MTRLEMLVCAIAPHALAQTVFAPQGFFDIKEVARDIVASAVALDEAIADRELEILKEANRHHGKT